MQLIKKIRNERGQILMKKIIYFLADWLSFGKDMGYIFALKYKLGIAQEGIDFFSAEDEGETVLQDKSNK